VLIDRAVEQWSALKDYSINWITSLLTFIGEELGEEAVERALRKTGDEFVRPRRNTGTRWSDLPASARAKVIARAMLGNMGEVDVDEDDEKITLSFKCGSGGCSSTAAGTRASTRT
jgi:predicted ArsR family transcriptional regulator